MKDQFGRAIDYLRISVTDRCNLRCIYCMPQEGIRWVPHSDVLSYEEITALVRIFASLGVRRLRLTGGEPLVRDALPDLVAALHAVPGIEEINLTTNGILFSPMAGALKAAGIHGINFSLDTLSPETFARITRTDRFSDARGAIDRALELGFDRVKINCIPIRGVNDGEIAAIAGLAKDMPLEVRFIEMMPIGCGKNYTPVTMEEVRHSLEAVYGPAASCRIRLGNGPASYVTFPGFRGHVGFIGAMTHTFCSQCNRVRLTSEGYLKLCLHYSTGIDLRAPLRRGDGEEALRETIRAAIARKPDQHHFAGSSGEDAVEQHNMNAIGG